MKIHFTRKIIFLLAISTNCCLIAKAQRSDSTKRIILVVRPGYNYDNSGGGSSASNSNSSTKPVTGSSSSSTTAPAGYSISPTYAPTTAERTGAPTYMDPDSKPIGIRFIRGDVRHQPVNSNTNTSKKSTEPTKKINGDDSMLLHKKIRGDTIYVVKKDTVFVTKTDTITLLTPKHHSNKILFLEIGGPGLAFSINYDQRFSDEKDGLGYRVGTGYFGDGGNTVFTIPLQVNYLLGSDGKFFEFGAGTTFINTTGDNKGKTFIFDRITGFIGTATIGVRYEPEKSLNFRLGFVPIFSNDEIIYAGGFSVGYTF